MSMALASLLLLAPVVLLLLVGGWACLARRGRRGTQWLTRALILIVLAPVLPACILPVVGYNAGSLALFGGTVAFAAAIRSLLTAVYELQDHTERAARRLDGTDAPAG